MRYRLTLIRLVFISVVVFVVVFPLASNRMALAAKDPIMDKIAFLAYRTAQPTQLMTINPDGSDLRQVAADERMFSVIWSPDRRLLCYGVHPDYDPPHDYFITDSMGSFTHAIKNTLVIGWSPDSQYLAYITGEGNQARLYLAKGDGSDPVLLIDKATSSFAWNADSHSLFIGIAGSLYLLDLDDKHFERLINYAVSPVNFALSPDGKQLSYFVGNSLYLLDTSTQSAKRVGTMPVDAIYRWSPDSQHVFFAARLKGGRRVYYLMNGDGSNLQRGRTFDSGDSFHFTWTPDGKYVWYAEYPYSPSTSLEIATGKLQVGNVVAEIAWSRDGKRGVFASTYPRDMLKIADPTFTNIQPIPETENLGKLDDVAW